jgi:hypothetical protein
MQEINILGIAYAIYLETGKTEIIYTDPLTGLQTKLYLLSLYIEPRNKHIQTQWRKQIIANNIVIKEETFSNSSSEADFLDFEGSMLGQMIKKSAVNGVFRFNLQNSFAIYNELGEIITPQPVAWPAEPEPEPEM